MILRVPCSVFVLHLSRIWSKHLQGHRSAARLDVRAAEHHRADAAGGAVMNRVSLQSDGWTGHSMAVRAMAGGSRPATSHPAAAAASGTPMTARAR
jgi:hypothetical protein